MSADKMRTYGEYNSTAESDWQGKACDPYRDGEALSTNEIYGKSSIRCVMWKTRNYYELLNVIGTRNSNTVGTGDNTWLHN